LESNGRLMIEEEESSIASMFDHFDQFEHWGHSGPRGYFVKREDGTKRHLTEVTGDKAVAFVKSCRPEQPFCLTLCFNAPHAQDDDPQQYFWPTRFDRLYQDATIPPPRNSEPAFFAAQPEFIRNSLGRERWRWRFDTPSKYQAMMKGMYRMVSGVDHVVGRVRSVLRDRGLHRNTVLVFTSDNGMFFGERGLSDCWLLYEESLRVPLLLYDPRGGIGGVVRDEMVLNLDLAPTLLALAGIEKEKRPPVDGRSMIPLLREESGEGWREDFLCEHLFEHAKIPRSEGVRTRRWKYIRYIDQVPVREELYDLHADPTERVNLVEEGQHAERLKKLRERCASLIRGSG
ncbi:MAG: sulfatase/phosphatase domain-containing protein, partial [Roseibacillus sp.]